MGTGDRSIESNHISSLTRVERDPYHGHSYKPKPSFMLLILKPWLDPKLLCTQALILLPVEMMLLRLMIERVLSCDTHDWQNYWVFSDVDCQLKVMPNRVYESWNCTTCNLQTYCSKHESHCFSSSTSFVAVIASQRTRACALSGSSSSQKFERLHIILLSTTHMSLHNTIKALVSFHLADVIIITLLHTVP